MKLATLVFVGATLAAGFASAQSQQDSVRTQLQNQGYTNVQINQNGSRYFVQAQRGSETREIEYDGRTGEITHDNSRHDGGRDNDNGRHSENEGHERGHGDSGHSEGNEGGHSGGSDSDHGGSDHSGGGDSDHGGSEGGEGSDHD